MKTKAWIGTILLMALAGGLWSWGQSLAEPQKLSQAKNAVKGKSSLPAVRSSSISHAHGVEAREVTPANATKAARSRLLSSAIDRSNDPAWERTLAAIENHPRMKKAQKKCAELYLNDEDATCLVDLPIIVEGNFSDTRIRNVRVMGSPEQSACDDYIGCLAMRLTMLEVPYPDDLEYGLVAHRILREDRNPFAQSE